MAGKQEKEYRKNMIMQIREKEKEEFLNTLPIAKNEFHKLFDYLDERSEFENCDNNLKMTQEFCQRNNLNFDKLAEWVRSHGAYCDCEVLMNVEEQFEGL